MNITVFNIYDYFDYSLIIWFNGLLNPNASWVHLFAQLNGFKNSINNNSFICSQVK